jgi:flagellar motor switch protein FliM
MLSQNEVDALLAAVGEGAGRAPAGKRDVRYYDFLHPERVSPVELRSLADVHEVAARSVGAALSGALRAPVECRLRTFDQAAWGEFVLGLPSPTCFGIAALEPDGGRFALEIGPSVLYPMMDGLLGAASPGEADVPNRPLTAIEHRIARTVVGISLGALAEVWRRARPVETGLLQLESNPQIVPLAPPTEMAALATFEIGYQGRAGLAHLCMPFGTLGRFLAELASAGAQLGGPGRVQAAKGALRAAIRSVPVHVEAIAGWARMRLRETVGLRPGDVMDLKSSGPEELVLTVGGVPKFRATVGEFRGRRAVEVTGRLERGPVGLGGKRSEGA